MGIRATAYFMVGAPDETIFMIGDTVRLLKRIKPQGMQLTKVVPLPGTYLYDIFEKRRLTDAGVAHSRYIYAKTSITWKTNKLTESEKHWLYEVILLEYSSTLKDALRDRNFSNLLYLLSRTILPFELINGVILFYRKNLSYVRSIIGILFLDVNKMEKEVDMDYLLWLI